MSSDRQLVVYHREDGYLYDFFIWNIPAAHVTHVLYEFTDANLNLLDEYTDTQRYYPHDDWANKSQTTLRGNLNCFWMLKHQHRHVKIMCLLKSVPDHDDDTFSFRLTQLLINFGLDGVCFETGTGIGISLPPPFEVIPLDPSVMISNVRTMELGSNTFDRYNVPCNRIDCYSDSMYVNVSNSVTLPDPIPKRCCEQCKCVGSCCPKTADCLPWAPGLDYSLNTLVMFNDQVFVCLRPHTSNSVWTPAVAPTLWKRKH